VIPLQYLPMCAGLAVSAGLDMEEAWRAITINPARQIGIADRVGSLEPGKDGDVVIWNGNLLTDVGADAAVTVLEGKVVYRAE
jgi:imidazolonepropionase-like amidohydrolase